MRRVCGIANLIFALVVLFMTVRSFQSAFDLEDVVIAHEAEFGMQNDYFMFTPPSPTQSVVGFLVTGLMAWSGVLLLKPKNV